MQRRSAVTTTLQTGLRPSDDTIDRAAELAADNELVVVTTNKAWTFAQQPTLVQRLVESGTPVVVVAVRDPYDVAHLPTTQTYLATYSYSAPSLEAAAKVLYGENAPTGKLPVTIPRADDSGTAPYSFGHGLGFQQ